jgi:chromosomal replication initiator protein
LSIPAAEIRPPDAADGRDDGSVAWLAPLRDCDLLIVEDAQYLSDRGAGPLADLLDHRLVRRRPVVVTAVRGPGQLPALPGRLASRLAGGLVVGMEPLGSTSRRRLARSLLAARKLVAEPAVLDWLAARPGGGLRPLLGALAHVESASRVHPPPIPLTAVLASAATEEGPGAESTADRLERIARRVGRQYRVEWRRLRGTDRRHETLWPRQVGMYLFRELTGLSLARIGAWFGGRDHTTVLHACRKVEERLADDSDLAGVLRQLRAELA